MIRAVLVLLLALMVPAPAARAQEAVRSFGSETARRQLFMRSTTDINVFAPVIQAFMATQSDLIVHYEQWGSNDLFDLSMSDCAEERAGADLVISSAVHQMVRLVNDACARAYRSPDTDSLPPFLRWRDELWGVTWEPAVMVYNRALVPPEDVPRTRFDLLDLMRPAGSPYAGRVATYDIEASGLGYLFAFADSLEATTFGALLESMARSGAIATCCSAEIIEGVAEGQYAFAYNVLGSYAQAFAETDPRVGIVAPQDYTLVLARALMIPRTADNAVDAAAFLDFLLSVPGRAVLQRVHLIDPLAGQGDDTTSESAVLRPLELSPRLLVALDQQKRAQFIFLWRNAFPR